MPGLQQANRPLRILVAEDTRSYQELVKAILGQRGHWIEIVPNGLEAVDRIQQDDFDVVLMDLQMPMMDGLEAAMAIRRSANARRATVPIIAMTAHMVRSNRESCLAANMDDYLSKPFEAAELVRLVEWHGSRGNTARARSGDDLPHESVEPATVSVLSFDEAELARLGGDSALMGKLVEVFRDDVPKQMGAIRAALERGDLSRVSEAARHLRDGASTLDARPTTVAAAALEQAAGAADMVAVHVALDALNSELAPLFESLERWQNARS